MVKNPPQCKLYKEQKTTQTHTPHANTIPMRTGFGWLYPVILDPVSTSTFGDKKCALNHAIQFKKYKGPDTEMANVTLQGPKDITDLLELSFAGPEVDMRLRLVDLRDNNDVVLTRLPKNVYCRS